MKRKPHKMLTKKELHDTSNERVHLISKEFTDGFNFLKKYPKSVTFFGGEHIQPESEYYKRAESLANKIVKDLNYAIVTGGGQGIMEAANKGAFSAGGQSLGLTIELSHEQVRNDYLTDNIDFYYFFSRKVCMSFSAEAYVFFPGGFGTFDEFYEIITLVQTGKIEPVPIILVGSDFWNPFYDLMKKEMLGRGTIDESDLDLLKIIDEEEKIVEIIRNTPVRNGVEFNHNHKS